MPQTTPPPDIALAPGAKVRRDYRLGGETPAVEYGVAAHCWIDPQSGLQDCQIVFFGDRPPPVGAPAAETYVLRYFARGLTLLDEWPDADVA